jgi:hypothetical protein
MENLPSIKLPCGINPYSGLTGSEIEGQKQQPAKAARPRLPVQFVNHHMEKLS